MKNHISRFLVFLSALLMFSGSNAQQPDRSNPSAPGLEELNIPSSSIFHTRLSSAEDWEQISYGRKLSYAFAALHRSDESIGLSDDDLELIELGAKGTPPNDRYYSSFAQACEFYYSQTNQGIPIDVSYVVRVFTNSDSYTLEDRARFYEELFNQVSIEARELLLGKIENARGTNLFSTSTTNWEAIGQKNPDRLKAAFVRGCATLEDRFEAYLYNRENPGERSILVPVTREESPNENQ